MIREPQALVNLHLFLFCIGRLTVYSRIILSLYPPGQGTSNIPGFYSHTVIRQAQKRKDLSCLALFMTVCEMKSWMLLAGDPCRSQSLAL